MNINICILEYIIFSRYMYSYCEHTCLIFRPHTSGVFQNRDKIMCVSVVYASPHTSKR